MSIKQSTRPVLVLALVVAIGLTLVAEEREAPTAAFQPKAALDPVALNQVRQIEYFEHNASEIASRLREATADDPKRGQWQRELDSTLRSLFALQQAQYRAENERLRERIATMDKTIARREEMQTKLIEEMSQHLLEKSTKRPKNADRESRQRELFALLLDAARLQHRIRQLQLSGALLTNLPDMADFRQEYGLTVRVEITGRDTGSIWGTDTYSDDSDIATAAVHAGVLTVGEKAQLFVEVVPSPPLFAGSSRNGIVSREYKTWPSGYVLRKLTASELARLPTPGMRAEAWTNRGQFGDRILVEITGSRTGDIWGEDIYTLDSDLSTAAVHAGVLQPGETGWVAVTLAKSPAAHIGSSRNGVVSLAWGLFPGSFVVQKASPPEHAVPNSNP